MSCGSCLYCLVLLAVFVALGLGLGLYFGVFNEEDFENLTGIDTPTLPPFFFRDPYDGISQAETPAWDNGSKGGGLSLKVVNACADSWDERFDEALRDWENGSPDALSLTTEKIQRDMDCEFVDGIMKVCNNDYGDTGWRGINEIQFDQRNNILASRAKLNDYFLEGASMEMRQYVACHEMGHGFGLAHTDEITNNANLGECMDYTNRFESNMRPGTSNFETLVGLYGQVDNNSRNLVASSVVKNNATRFPDFLLQEYEQSARSLLRSYNGDDSTLEAEGWRLLHKSDFGASYVLNLGGGYGVRASMLLA